MVAAGMPQDDGGGVAAELAAEGLDDGAHEVDTQEVDGLDGAGKELLGEAPAGERRTFGVVDAGLWGESSDEGEEPASAGAPSEGDLSEVEPVVALEVGLELFPALL